MNEKKLNIKKTKYRYFKDNLSLFPIKPIMKYTIPVPKGEETKDTEFLIEIILMLQYLILNLIK